MLDYIRNLPSGQKPEAGKPIADEASPHVALVSNHSWISVAVSQAQPNMFSRPVIFVQFLETHSDGSPGDLGRAG